MATCLVTGGAGFIGSNLTRHMLAGDGDLGFVQARELTCGYAALGLELEVAKARPAGQRARPTGHENGGRVSCG